MFSMTTGYLLSRTLVPCSVPIAHDTTIPAITTSRDRGRRWAWGGKSSRPGPSPSTSTPSGRLLKYKVCHSRDCLWSEIAVWETGSQRPPRFFTRKRLRALQSPCGAKRAAIEKTEAMIRGVEKYIRKTIAEEDTGVIVPDRFDGGGRA